MTGNSNTIIVVEDDAPTVELFNHIFRHDCVTVFCIASDDLYQLDKIVQAHQPQLLILDYMSIRRNFDLTIDILMSLAPNIPTLVTTSIDDDSLSDTFNYVIRKPFYKSDIMMIIQDIVQDIF